MKKYTIWVMYKSHLGSTYITSVEARTQQSAEKKAIAECAEEWGELKKSLTVVGVALGDVTILEWNDDV